MDETLLKFKGRFQFKQHIRGKPNSTGVKVYVLADHTGFFYSYFFYQGKNGKTEEIVKNFVSQLPKKYSFTVMTDSYYGGLNVAQYLQKNGLNFLLLCTKNRPTALFESFLHKDLHDVGDVSWAVSEDQKMLSFCYKSRKIVNVLINYGNPSSETTTLKGKTVPAMIQDYNLHMHGVDKGDRNVNTFLPIMKNRSWKKVALDGNFYIALSNSFLFQKNLNSNKLKLKEFFIQVAYQLSPLVQPTKSPSFSKKSIHFLVSSENPKKSNCESCIKKIQDKRTTKKCVSCEMFFHEECFIAYHLKKNEQK